MWPFHLNSPKGGYEAKRHSYLNNGSHGPRDEFINELIQRMVWIITDYDFNFVTNNIFEASLILLIYAI